MKSVAHGAEFQPFPDDNPTHADSPDPDDGLGEAHVAPLVGFTLVQLATNNFPARKALLQRGDTVVFRAGHIGQIYAERGVGKTWFGQTLALVAATEVTALEFHAPAPCTVLYVDGEMGSEEIKSRFAELEDRLHITPPQNLTVVGADWQDDYLPRLDTSLGQALLEPFVHEADLIVLDNRATLFNSEGEKDAKAWQPAQDWLLSLRRRGKGTMLVHHSNRMGGARGLSNPEDPMNLLIKLAHPEGYEQQDGARFVVSFEKHRGIYGAAVTPFLAHLTCDGWQMHGLDGLAQARVREKIIEHVTLAQHVGERVKSATAAINAVKVNKAVGLKAWKTLLESHAILKHPDKGFYVA